MSDQGGAIFANLFYFLAIVATLAALGTVFAKRILRAAVCLTGVLFVSAGFYILLDMEFLAGVQVLLYIGGIVVLLVFAIMLTSTVELYEIAPSKLRRAAAAVIATLFFSLCVYCFQSTSFTSRGAERIEDDLAQIGRSLLDFGANGYVLPFELISLLLLGVLIGSIVVARKALPKSETLPVFKREDEAKI